MRLFKKQWAARVERKTPVSHNILAKKLFTLLDLCVSSLRRGHANLLCIVPILTDDPRRGSINYSAECTWAGAIGHFKTRCGSSPDYLLVCIGCIAVLHFDIVHHSDASQSNRFPREATKDVHRLCARTATQGKQSTTCRLHVDWEVKSSSRCIESSTSFEKWHQKLLNK